MALMALTIPGSVLAADDGDLGTSSTGTSTITVDIDPIVRITGVDDLTKNNYQGVESPLNLFSDVCVYSNNTASGNYQIQMDGSGASGAFTITNSTETIDYTPYWHALSTGHSGGTDVSDGEKHAFTGANTESDTCVSGTDTESNATFYIDILKADLLKVPADTYTGTLTITMTPN